MTHRYRRIFDLGLGGGQRARAEMDLEIEAHLAMRTADLVGAGWPPDAARAEALRRFGDFDQARRTLHAGAQQRERAMRHRDWWGTLRTDLRLAARHARRSPGYTTLVVAMFAIGVGATTGMFTLVDAVALRPLPFPSPDQLIRIDGRDSLRHAAGVVSSADWLDWKKASALQVSAIYSFSARETLVTDDSAFRVTAERVSSDFFSVLRPRFLVGRGFADADIANGSPEVVISEGLWHDLFNSDPALTKPLRTPRATYRVVGVVPAEQEFPAFTDAWFAVPITAQTDPARVNVNWQLIARRQPNATDSLVARQIEATMRGIRAIDPSASYDFGANIQPLAQYVNGDTPKQLELLLGVVAFVLLIVCANVAAFGLARSSARHREMAVRSALGAGRGRLMQQLLVEQLSIAVVGGVIGLFVAWLTVRGVLGVWSGAVTHVGDVRLGVTVFVFALVVAAAAGILAGLLPALRVSAPALSSTIGSGGRAFATGGRRLSGATLVAFEVALAVALLTGSGLLIRSFRAVLARSLGFDTSVATVEAALGGPAYAQDTVRRYAYWDALVRSYRAIPGVQAVGLAQWIPLGLTGIGFIDVADHPVADAGAVYRSVNEDFFRALQIPLVAGRTFSADDAIGGERVALVNNTMAQKYWPGQNPIGRLVRARSMEKGKGPGGEAPWLRIIGVVGDVRTYGHEADVRAEMYVFFRQTPWLSSSLTALVRASQPPSRIELELRRRALAVDRHVAVDVGTLEQRAHGTLASRELSLSLLVAFAAVALLLAVLGIYGVLSYSVTQRTRELAIRAALGASRADLVRLVFGDGMRIVVLGLICGVGAAIALTRFLTSMLVDVTPLDAVSFSGAVAVLTITAGLGILLPARRAAGLDPRDAMQTE